MLAAYPKLLTDPEWKKVEKAAGVSATGVGKTLRDAAAAWGTFASQIAGWEKGQVSPTNANAGKKHMIDILGKSQTLLKGLLPKVKDANKKTILTDYSRVLASLVGDLQNNFNVVDDHRGADFVVTKFNAHVKAGVSGFKHTV
jgi:hypothetical protein